MSKKNSQAPAAEFPALAIALLLVASLAESLLALYQWMELLAVRAGGTALCALSETVNCTTVWNSAFATRLHSALGMPVAGLGLVWGLTAFFVSLVLAYRALKGEPWKTAVGAVRLVAAVGVLSCVSFAVGSIQAGAVCLTCLTTFALVFGFGAVAVFMLPGALVPVGAEMKTAVGLPLLALVPIYGALLYPGLKTPSSKANSLPTAPVTAKLTDSPKEQRPAHPEDPVAGFLAQLPAMERQAVSDSLDAYRRSPVIETRQFSVRQRYGPENAPTKIVEFTDIRCGHCRALVEVMAQLKKILPEGKISVEPRSFPLDSECNNQMKFSDGKGISCLGAKAQICLEGAPDFWTIYERLFAAQEGLTKEKILEIASSGSVSRSKLEACLKSPETQKKLQEDIDYAMLFNPEGTPLVVVNGRMGTPAPAWLYSMALVDADPNATSWTGLPPPMPVADRHEGHEH